MRADTRCEYTERILRVLVHIRRNLDAELDLEQLAAVACFSPFHFHRVFTGMVGESVKRHVRRLRLERAAMRLKHEDRPVTAIALNGRPRTGAKTRGPAACRVPLSTGWTGAGSPITTMVQPSEQTCPGVPRGSD